MFPATRYNLNSFTKTGYGIFDLVMIVEKRGEYRD